MAERDPQFEQDVLQIVYAALSDREALAAAMAGQQPMPVPSAAPGQTDPSAPSAPGASLSPTEVGVQGGAPDRIPPARALYCGQIVHIAYEDLYLRDPFEGDSGGIAEIRGITKASREQVMQELMRRALQAEVRGLLDAVKPQQP